MLWLVPVWHKQYPISNDWLLWALNRNIAAAKLSSEIETAVDCGAAAAL